ncbi:hypothetical protein HMPREF1868_01720 [Olsenella sp. DNF00959]|nr:hypothetical protein HMPREF1868_01720 [Olsenella sp. DNF00959]
MRSTQVIALLSPLRSLCIFLKPFGKSPGRFWSSSEEGIENGVRFSNRHRERQQFHEKA